MALPGSTPGLFPSLPKPATSASVRSPGPTAERFSHLWLCIYLPGLALEALDENADAATVVVDGEGSHCRVHVANKAAYHHGIRAGAKLNAAYALCPELKVCQRDLLRERERLQKLAVWATRFTPWVQVEQPAALLLEVRGSLHLFAGATGLSNKIRAKLAAMQHRQHLAMAPTPLAALWLARSGRGLLLQQAQQLPGQLGKLPLYCLGWPDKIVASLKGMGVYNVRDCLRLPRDGFARRFGKQYLQQLDRALGRMPDPRPAFVAPARFRKTLEMPAETADTQLLLLATEKLLKKLSAYLVRRQAGVQNIALRLVHDEQSPTVIRIGLLEQSQDTQRLLSLARLKLDSLELTAPVISLQLLSGKVSTLAGHERQLFDCQPGSAADHSALLENLRARLGVSAVFGIAGVADHRPESAWQRVEKIDKKMEKMGTDHGFLKENRGLSPFFPFFGLSPFLSRPLWLLAQPQRLQVLAGKPQYDGPLVYESGPERIETGWWDSNDIVRDYYVLRAAGGLRLWAYRERRAPGNWYLHGFFG
ncbi:MAG: DNA polymerase Y family protein [Gammaproteobacteria bacterium]|nr:DNA polymerase Y family protein [Gammaproteobacteria bacterium]